MTTDPSERFKLIGERISRMMRAWSPALRDRLFCIYVAAIDEGRHLSDEDVTAILGFDPTNIDELKPPWRNPIA
jgi:hypothetical protein